MQKIIQCQYSGFWSTVNSLLPGGCIVWLLLGILGTVLYYHRSKPNYYRGFDYDRREE